MKSRTIPFILAIVVGFAVGFWLYGIGRTMRETVHFDRMAFVSGLLLGVALPLIIVLPLFIASKLWFGEKVWPVSLPLVAFVVSLLVGSLASEAWILRDEGRFSAEANGANAATLYSRPRAWPNRKCSLVFVPGKGIHSTD